MDPIIDKITSDTDPNLREVLHSLWKQRIIIFYVVLASSITSLAIALSMPDMYRSTVTLSSSSNSQNTIYNALSSQYGGLANLAGIDIDGGAIDNAELALEVAKTLSFFTYYVDNHSILPELMAVKTWDQESATLVIDEELYDIDAGKWVREVDFPKKVKPSYQEAYEEFLDHIQIEKDSDTGLVRLSIAHQWPEIAKRWVDNFVDDLNTLFKDNEISEVEHSIEFLENELENTSISQLREGLFEMLQAQLERKMLANATPDFVFKIIDNAVVSEEKYGPNRLLIMFFGFAFGGAVGVFVVLVRQYFTV